MRAIKILFKSMLIIFGLFLIILVFSIAPVDRSDFHKSYYYKEMRAQFNNWVPKPKSKQNIKVGWSIVNFTPTKPTPTAGYGDRQGKPYQSVHDSVYIRAVVFSNGIKPYAIVSCDLLIFPPEVVIALKKKLKPIDFTWQQIYASATHTHNSLGAWGKNAIGEQFAGKYDQTVVDHIAEKVVLAIAQAKQNLSNAKIGFEEINAKELVFNRLVGDESGSTDPMVRVLKIEKENGEIGLITTFSAHATTLNADKNFLSADYPGEVMSKLNKKVAFAAFMAGTVGSSGPIGEELPNDFVQMQNISEGISKKVIEKISTIKCEEINELAFENFAIPMNDPQVRFAENWRVRPWIFNNFFGEYKPEIKALKIGKNILIGMPCDYSGELIPDALKSAKTKNLNLIVTSFNGSYVGYITLDKHYDLNAYETRVMNWYGPQNGTYFQEIIRNILIKI